MNDCERLVDALRREFEQKSGLNSVALGVDPETLRIWKANAGNAKARRRWRRRNFPNTQTMMLRVQHADTGPASQDLGDAMEYVTSSLWNASDTATNGGDNSNG